MSHAGVRKLGPGEVRDRRAGGEAIVAVDVRTADARAMHPVAIPGAHWIPLSEVVSGTQTLPRDATLLTYCT